MTKRDKLEEMLHETLQLAERLDEGIIVYLLQNALLSYSAANGLEQAKILDEQQP